MCKKTEKTRNYLMEAKELLCRIRTTQLEPECCNISCPPLGCPRGPCPGMCLDKNGWIDVGCTSKLPACFLSSHQAKASPAAATDHRHPKSNNSCCNH